MEGIHPFRNWRQKQKPPLSQEDAAKGVTTKATISRIETGQRTPSLTLAAKLSEKSGIPISKFVKIEEAAQ